MKHLVYLILLLATFSSCGSKSSAFRFSQDIVKKEQSLVKDIERTEDQVFKFANENKYDSIAVVATRMEKLVDDRLQEVQRLPLPDAKEADAFKKAAVNYFSYLKSVYTAYKNFGLATTEEARDKERTHLLKIVDEKNEAVNAMQRMQKKYAAVNGFKVR